MRKSEALQRLARAEASLEIYREELRQAWSLIERERQVADGRVDQLLTFIMSPDMAGLHARADKLALEADYPSPVERPNEDNEPTLGVQRGNVARDVLGLHIDELRAAGISEAAIMESGLLGDPVLVEAEGDAAAGP